MSLLQTHNIILLILISLTLSLQGCNDKANIPSESEVTIAFFDAIYNQKDLNKTLSLSSARLKKEIKKYKTLNNFSRRALNLSFDSVTIETQKSKTKVIDEFNVQATITVMITGLRNERTYKEVKKVQLIKKDNAWLIDKLLKVNRY